MSLPESEKELLLSASLDDALSPEEQDKLDRWFREDPSAHKRRDELAALVSSVRTAYQPLTRANPQRRRLGREFADSIVEQAIACAAAENLPASHPLIKLGKLGETHVTSPASAASLRWPRIAAAAVLAASLMLAVVISQQQAADPNVPADGAIAQVDPQREPLSGVFTDRADGAVRIAATDPSSVSDPAQSPAQSIASLPLAADAAAVPADRMVPADVAAESIVPSRSLPTELAMSGAAADRDKSPEATLPLTAVMVVSLELTEAGRSSLALLEALRNADIRLGSKGVVSEQVVSELRRTDVIQTLEGDSSAKLYFVEAPAKQIDQFLMRVMSDKDSFASIGLSIADNPPLLASIDRWRPSDAENRSDTAAEAATGGNAASVARDLVFGDGQPLAIDRGAAIIPMDRDLGTAGLLMQPPSPQAGGNFTSQLLLLVR